MSAENKKLLWIAIAVVAVVLVLAGTAVAFFYPRKGGGAAPASINNTAAPKSADPQDYLAAPQLEPSAITGKSDSGDVIVIYGDKPAGLDGNPGEGASAIAATAATAATATGGTGSTDTAGATGTAKPAADQVTAPAASPATKAPIQAKTVAKTSTTPPKATAKALPPANQYWIQAGSFASRGKADELKDVLSKKGLSGLVTVTEIKGKTWYRVRVGPYVSNSEASGWLSRVKAIPGCEEAGIWKGSSSTK